MKHGLKLDLESLRPNSQLGSNCPNHKAPENSLFMFKGCGITGRACAEADSGPAVRAALRSGQGFRSIALSVSMLELQGVGIC